MLSKKKYSGVVVPMVSPLTEKREADREAVEKIIRSFAQHNVSPLLLGTTGESASFASAESAELVKAAVSAKAPNQQLYVGLVGTVVQDLVNSANKYFELGADVVVPTLPAYYVLTAAQMAAYYQTLADRIAGPLMMYNIKTTTQMTIPLEVIERLSEHQNIRGLKDSDRDLNRLQRCINTFKDREDFSFFCGWGAQSAASLIGGADGIVPSTGNLVPALYRKLYEAAVKQDKETADKYQTMTDEVAMVYQTDRTLGQSLAALKVMMGVLDLCKPYMMPPLSELDQQEVEKIQELTTKLLKQTLSHE